MSYRRIDREPIFEFCKDGNRSVREIADKFFGGGMSSARQFVLTHHLKHREEQKRYNGEAVLKVIRATGSINRETLMLLGGFPDRFKADDWARRHGVYDKVVR